MFGLVSFLICVVVLLFFKVVNIPHEPPVLGVYRLSSKFYYVKFTFMFLLLTVRQLVHRLRRRLAVELGHSDDGTEHIHKDDNELEQLHNLGAFHQSVDAVYFNGVSRTGAVVLCNVARRPADICNSFLYLKVEGGELLLSPKLPDTTLTQMKQELNQYAVEGLVINNVIPMRSWKIYYKGEMKARSDQARRVQVDLELTWSTAWNPFLFDTEMSPQGMARDMALETWNSNYFQLIKRFHQNHYEQMGVLDGTVKIDGVEHKLSMPCVRDHSFGHHRDWHTFHRYVLHYIYLENGECLAVMSISKPILFSNLTAGYVCRNSDHKVRPITSSTFQLYQHGENEKPPTDYAFSFRAGGESYFVKVLIEDESVFYIGEDRHAKFYERWAAFEVNGVKGWGCTEWYYKNRICL